MSTIAKVRVPATTANMGPGFDCLGAALTLYNHFEFRPLGTGKPLQITVEGEEAARVPTDEGNLVYRTFRTFYDKVQLPKPPVHIHIVLNVPLSRGLGSSSTAIVGGLLGANLLAGNPLDDQALAALATDIEGHPDNVVPALLGGCRLAATQPNRPYTICDVPWPSTLVPVVAIPNFELSTAKARAVLPDQYSRADAVFNVAHLGLLLRGLAENRKDWIQAALCDRIHQPYRQALIPGYETVRQVALDAGSWGVVISGAGPTLLALTPSTTVETVQKAIEGAWQGADFTIRVFPLALDTEGAIGELIKP